MRSTHQGPPNYRVHTKELLCFIAGIAEGDGLEGENKWMVGDEGRVLTAPCSFLCSISFISHKPHSLQSTVFIFKM